MGRFDQEFKQMLVQLAESGHPTKELAKEYSVSKTTINTWRREYKKNGDSYHEAGPKDSPTGEGLVKALEKQVKELKLERDILKKAVRIFSEND